ncbi:hypothetical protein ACTPOE_08365 [Castellaniella sp. WN]
MTKVRVIMHDIQPTHPNPTRNVPAVPSANLQRTSQAAVPGTIGDLRFHGTSGAATRVPASIPAQRSNWPPRGATPGAENDARAQPPNTHALNPQDGGLCGLAALSLEPRMDRTPEEHAEEIFRGLINDLKNIRWNNDPGRILESLVHLGRMAHLHGNLLPLRTTLAMHVQVSEAVKQLRHLKDTMKSLRHAQLTSWQTQVERLYAEPATQTALTALHPASDLTWDEIEALYSLLSDEIRNRAEEIIQNFSGLAGELKAGLESGSHIEILNPLINLGQQIAIVRSANRAWATHMVSALHAHVRQAEDRLGDPEYFHACSELNLIRLKMKVGPLDTETNRQALHQLHDAGTPITQTALWAIHPLYAEGMLRIQPTTRPNPDKNILSSLNLLLDQTMHTRLTQCYPHLAQNLDDAVARNDSKRVLMALSVLSATAHLVSITYERPPTRKSSSLPKQSSRIIAWLCDPVRLNTLSDQQLQDLHIAAQTLDSDEYGPMRVLNRSLPEATQERGILSTLKQTLETIIQARRAGPSDEMP